MHPTLDEQLEGIACLIERTAERHPDDPAAQRLRTAAGTLRRIAASWEAIPHFFRWDNEAMVTLLRRFEAPIPEALAARVAGRSPRESDPSEGPTNHDDNKALRGLLADLVRELPADAMAARAEIGAHLRERITRDPSSGRHRR